jgi:hypothetical protein
MARHRVRERPKDRVILMGGTGRQPPSPIRETGKTDGIVHSQFIGKIVGGTRKGVNGRNGRAEGSGQPQRGDGKVFVMAAGEALTGGISFFKASDSGRKSVGRKRHLKLF